MVDAVNMCIDLNIEFPSDHAEQRRIAEGFRAISSASIEVQRGTYRGYSM